MKIENQVCDLSQAIKLMKLGVVVTDTVFQYYDDQVATRDWIEENLSGAYLLHPAYNVAELGLALGDRLSMIRPRFDQQGFCFYWDRMQYFPTEAQARAELLILVVEARILTAQDVVKRISES